MPEGGENCHLKLRTVLASREREIKQYKSQASKGNFAKKRRLKKLKGKGKKLALEFQSPWKGTLLGGKLGEKKCSQRAKKATNLQEKIEREKSAFSQRG